MEQMNLKHSLKRMIIVKYWNYSFIQKFLICKDRLEIKIEYIRKYKFNFSKAQKYYFFKNIENIKKGNYLGMVIQNM